MRRIAGVVLLGLGAFLLAAAALVRWYAYPTLAVAPVDQDSTSFAVGEEMTYFDRGTLGEQTGTLTSKIRVIGLVKASEDEGDNVAVWDRSTVTTTDDGTEISVTQARVPFDRKTGRAVKCCEASVDEEPIDFEGGVFKFPFGAGKESYDWWDSDLEKSVPFEYSGEKTIDGLKTLRFTMRIEPTKIGEVQVPPRVLREVADEVLTAETWYANERTVYVEPETGALIDVEENVNKTLRYNGEDRVVTTRGLVSYPDSQVRENVDTYQSLANQLRLLRAILPIAGLVSGLIAAVAGLALLRQRREEFAADVDHEFYARA
jgi:hypothetical protein